MKLIELIDFQTFVTEKARSKYFDLVKNKYDYAVFEDEKYRYNLYLYDEIISNNLETR